MRSIRPILIVAAAVLLPSVAVACMWDYDTIKMERSRFPNTLELITGKFLRHSPEFYEWRIRDRLKKLESDPANPGYLDDLAVAYDKTGQNRKAIETMLRKEQLHPGLYETAANLSVFYFHAGELETSLSHVNRALAINPDAHFGREKYQKSLTEFAIHRKREVSLPFPVAPGDRSRGGFGSFLLDQRRVADPNATLDAERSAAIKAVLGMMRFANFESPLLLESLGSLLTSIEASPQRDAKLLAARAYLKASYEVANGPPRQEYRTLAKEVLSMQTMPGRGDQIALEQVEADFQKELSEAREWYAQLRERELSWIRDGLNPEAEFDKLYDAEPELSGMDAKDPMNPNQKFVLLLTGVAIGMGLGLLGATAIALTFVCWQVSRAAAKWCG